MSAEGFLSKQLQKFSILDLSLVKTVYFVFGLLIFSLYPRASLIDWWFYLILFLIAAIPIEIHLFSQPGNLLEKAQAYLKTNNPSNQVLLFLSTFFFAFMLGSLIPLLVSGPWWLYLLIMAVFAIKPLTKTWCW